VSAAKTARANGSHSYESHNRRKPGILEKPVLFVNARLPGHLFDRGKQHKLHTNTLNKTTYVLLL